MCRSQTPRVSPRSLPRSVFQVLRAMISYSYVGRATLCGAVGGTVAARRGLALSLVKCSFVLGVLAKQIARREFFPGTGMNPIHVSHHFLEADAFRISQRPS